MAMRLLAGFGVLAAEWQEMLIFLAVLSTAMANIVAIAQSNIKRVLAYTTIVHMKFLSLGLLVGTKSGYGSILSSVEVAKYGFNRAACKVSIYALVHSLAVNRQRLRHRSGRVINICIGV